MRSVTNDQPTPVKLPEPLLQFFGPICELLSLDDYYRTDRSSGPFTEPNDSGQVFFDLNHPQAIDWNWVKADLNAALEREAQILIVEGLFALAHRELRERMGLRLFVDYPDDLRLARKITRNFTLREVHPQVTLTNYLNSGRPGHTKYVEETSKHADFIIKGEVLERDEHDRILHLIAAAVSGTQVR